MTNLPKTDTTATLTFDSSQQADEFARLYTRKTLMGHSVGGSTVKIWNVTDDIKKWIDSYINRLNNA